MEGQMLNKLKKIKPKHILEMLVILISFIPGMILRLIKRDIWIVAENGDDAKDNGYAFFKYAMENKSKKDIYYVITKKSIYYDKLKKYNKNLLYKNSLKHNIYTIASTKYISSQIGSGLPFPELVFNFQGTFIYRLAGREREKSASYYTPEVLTKCLVKYVLKVLYYFRLHTTTLYCFPDILQAP